LLKLFEAKIIGFSIQAAFLKASARGFFPIDFFDLLAIFLALFLFRQNIFFPETIKSVRISPCYCQYGHYISCLWFEVHVTPTSFDDLNALSTLQRSGVVVIGRLRRCD